MKVEKYLSREVIKEQLDDWVRELREKKILAKTTTVTEITETFKMTSELKLKDVLFFLRFFPLIYRDMKQSSVLFEIPIDGMYVRLRLEDTMSMVNWGDSKMFKAAFLMKNGKGEDLASIQSIANDLQKVAWNFGFKVFNNDIAEPIKNVLQVLLDSTLISSGHFEKAFVFNHNKWLNKEIKEDIIKAGIKFLLSTSLQRFQPSMLQDLYHNLREQLHKYIVYKVENRRFVKLKYELTYSMMMTASLYRREWQDLSTNVIVSVKDHTGDFITITVNPTNKVNLRTIFKLLQSILYFSHGKVKCVVPFGGKNRIFYLSRAKRGHSQIIVQTNNNDWEQEARQEKKLGDIWWAPDYNSMIKVLTEIPDQKELASTMIQAYTSPLNNVQPNFEHILKKPLIIRCVFEFLVIAMVADAAAPTEFVKIVFIEKLAEIVEKKKTFPGWKSMPKLEKPRKDVKGSGRSPTMDDVALELLYKMREGKFKSITDAFSLKNFPAIKKQGGTDLARKYVYYNGESYIPSFWIIKKADEIVEAATCVWLI
ncbi:hypothetical protein AC249_AIPGENE283 [Exaiptasia diaphana]|nr:hypothetical protein AC249_AIPGENE283 [Exaiptasia diaphana]